MKYQKSSHVTYDVRYHLVWITKYRQKVLIEDIQKSLDKVLKDTCDKIWVVIIKVWYEVDHIHMYIRIPLNKWISEVVWYIKWKSSYIMKKKHYKYFRNKLRNYSKLCWESMKRRDRSNRSSIIKGSMQKSV